MLGCRQRKFAYFALEQGKIVEFLDFNVPKRYGWAFYGRENTKKATFFKSSAHKFLFIPWPVNVISLLPARVTCKWTRLFQNWAEGGGSGTFQKYFLVFILNTNPRSCKSIWGPWTRCEHLEVKIKRFSSSFGVLNLTKWRKCAKSSPSGRPSEVGIRREKWTGYGVLAHRMW